jgi:DNA topoisomerase-3
MSGGAAPGPCQFPTLGFVVARYQQVQDFVSEPFWKIDLSLTRHTSSKTQTTTDFTWRRGHIFNFRIAAVLYQEVMSNPKARVTKVTSKGAKKW